VDDEESFTRLLKLNLEQTQSYVVRVENGAERALNAAREFRPDLVLLDVIMPRMTGTDVARSLRADAVLRAIPIVILSAVGGRKTADDRNHPLEGYPWIAKPASVEELIDGIERNLPGHRSDASAAAGPPPALPRLLNPTLNERTAYDSVTAKETSADCR
jgi:DNA-binding response OmpR family regulator